MIAMAPRRPTACQPVVIDVSMMSAASWKVSPATSHRAYRSQTSRRSCPEGFVRIRRRPVTKACTVPMTMITRASPSMRRMAFSVRKTSHSFMPCSMPRAARGLLHLLHGLIDREGVRTLDRRELPEGLEELPDDLRRDEGQDSALDQPVPVRVRGDVRELVGIGAQVVELGQPQGRERLRPDLHRPVAALLHEDG